MNLTEMISLVRSDLHDEDSGNYRWSDAELTRHISRAVAELSESLPLPAKATLPTSAGSRELDISGLSDRMMVAAVEYPVGATPPDYQQFSIWGDMLTIMSGSQPDGSTYATSSNDFSELAKYFAYADTEEKVRSSTTSISGRHSRFR